MRNRPTFSLSNRSGTLVVTMALLAGVAACGTDDPAPAATTAPAAAPTGAPAGAACPEDAGKGKPVWYADGAGGVVAGLSQGDGPVVAILSHQNGGDACEWLPFAGALAEERYRVVALDLPGFGASAASAARPDQAVAAVATHLWQQGATSIVLVGASMGGTASLVASTTTQAPVNGVVTLSAPASFAGMDTATVLPKLTAATLFIAGKGDGEYAAAVETFDKGVPDGLSHTKLIVDTGAHGTALIRPDDAASKAVHAEILTWVKDRVPAPGA